MQYYPQGPIQYYQQSGTPGWGTSQFQFGPPAAPGFQPQPSWSGRDYYRAHAADADPNLFDHAWNSVRDYRDYESSGAVGVGVHEARHWHRRAYGGLGELTQMEPPEIGHAAAYEAYRTWIHNSSMYEPLSGDIERQREALIGLATAEASRLFQYTRRPMDSFARTEACECAAATASHIFYWSRERDEGEYFRGRSHQGGFADIEDDPYALDMDVMHPRQRPRSHSRHRSSSVHPPMGYAGSGGMPIGYAGSGSGMPPPPMGMPGYAGSANGVMPHSAAPMYPPGGMNPVSYTGSFSGTYPQQYGMQMPAQQPYGMSPTYGAPSMVMPDGRVRSGSFSMPYGQQPQYVGVQGVQQYVPGQQYAMGQPVISPPLSSGQPSAIIVKSHRKHRHRSSSRHHGRSRSVEGMYEY